MFGSVASLVGPERAELELAAVGLRVSRGDRDRFVEVVALQDVETGDPLLRLGERSIGDEHLAAADSDRGGLADRAQGITGDALPPAVDVGHPLLDGQVLRGRLGLGGGGRVDHRRCAAAMERPWRRRRPRGGRRERERERERERGEREDDLDEAIAMAARHPQANGGKLELRPFWTDEDWRRNRTTGS